MGTAHGTFTFVAFPVNHGRRCFKAHPRFVCQQRESNFHLVRIHLAAHPSRNHQNPQRSDRPEGSEQLELARVRAVDTVECVCVLHVCQPPLLMHVHLGGETYPHRDLDESGSQPVRRTRHSSKLSEFIGRELVSVCSRTALAQRHQFQLIHKFLLSQMKAAVRKCLNFNPCQCEIVLIPRSPLQRFLKVLTEQLRRWDGHHIQPPRNRPRGLR